MIRIGARSLFSAVVLALSGLCLAAAAWAQDVPKFVDYPAAVYRGAHAPVKLDTPDARSFRTRLRAGAKEPVNFGGHYILTTWGCGNRCQTGAVINAKNGNVVFLPHTVCCWKDGDLPFYFKEDSRLIVFGGMLDEEEPAGAHFYEFTGREFRLVAGPQPSEPGVSNGSAGDPRDTIAKVLELVATHKMPDRGTPEFGEVAKDYLSAELLAAIQDGSAAAERSGENIWDAETFTGAQGMERLKFFGATVKENNGGKALVIADIGISDTDVEPTIGAKYRYEMRFEDRAWKIDDITAIYEDEPVPSLKRIFLDALLPTDTEPAAGPSQGIGEFPPLMIAIAQKDIVTAKALMRDPKNVRYQLPPEQGGGTPLMTAALFGDKPLVELLLAHGADVRALDARGRSALWVAAMQAELEIAKLLLAVQGANTIINVPDSDTGFTSLQLAFDRADVDMVTLFMKSGANPNVVNYFGTSVASRCQDRSDFVCSIVKGR